MTTSVGDLFAFAVEQNGVIKIPKAALELAGEVTAGQFFAALLRRGAEYYPNIPLRQGDHAISVSIPTFSRYLDPATNQIVGVFRTQIDFKEI
jgi:hypothetical protein